MNKYKFFLSLLLLSLMTNPVISADFQTQSDQLYTRRFAFLVGANNGGKDRVILRYAVDDARAIEDVLKEMGGLLPGDSHFLEEPDREKFFSELEKLSKDVAKARNTFRRVEVILYYSGHSDEESIYLGNSRVTYKEFRDIITSMNADVRIAILDSCASGALTLPKGVIKKSPFLMDTAYDMKGYAFMTSSSASEAAQESGRLGRSYFTHNLISGMRGAADMNLDGRITLNEAYQFAFDGTLTQTEKTMAGPQHPNYHIQMSGTGDVVITEIRESSAVLVLNEDIDGKFYIHNKDNVLIVELEKKAGRKISIGLNEGDYRIINLSSRDIFESILSLENGKSFELDSSHFSQTDKIPTVLRGSQAEYFHTTIKRRHLDRWQFEISGGFAAVNPEDLNLRAQFDEKTDLFYSDDYFQYQINQGEIASFTKTNEGGNVKRLKHSIPLEIRLRYSITRWLDLSIGFSHFYGSRTSSLKNSFEVVDMEGLTSVYTNEYSDYTLAAKGYIPNIGIHFGKQLTPFLTTEAYISGGPLFAECKYSILFNSQWSDSNIGSEYENPEDGILEERGSGTGFSLQTGIKLDLFFTKRMGWFIEGSYAYQNVSSISGPGTRSVASLRDDWEGEWGIKQDVRQRAWGTARFLWPSNGWDIFGGTWWRTRNFELNLSGFQAKMGLIFRF
ncbi:caspase domain-containing protein [Acidobacteriota bacterium]